MRHLIFLVASLISLTAYAADFSDLATYFPIEKGNSWLYQLANMPPSWRVAVTDCQNNEFGGKDCTIFSQMDSQLPEMNDIYSIRGNTILNTVSAGGLMPGVTEHLPPIYILKSPLIVGTTWENISKNGKDKEVFKVVGKGKESVPAGEFDDVIKISRVYFEKNKKTKKWQKGDGVNVFLYYAPNVGLIKEEHMKKAEYPFRQLIEYTPKKKDWH